MGRSLEYPKRGHNTVNRLGKNRGVYDLEIIHSIINTSLVLNVSFASSPDDEFPAILPMIGAMASFENPSAGLDEPLDCYLHGYVSSRIMNLTRQAQEAGKPGLPVCIAASKVDGLILAISSFSHSYNYRSAVLFGYAQLVTDLDGKQYAMEQITNKVVSDRWNNTRLPINKAELSSTQMLRVQINSGSGKIRDGPPADDKADLADKKAVDSIWTGYLPVTETIGEPVASSYNKIAVPQHVTEYREKFNDRATEYSDACVKRVREMKVTYGDV
jgi:nitroimidazol reductase NimA-like FMN-containing flavoprotein (pyridoxamine 5'-phosphate oxidase superfamily)